MQFRRRSKDDFIEDEVLDKCWSPDVDFTNSALYKYWLHLDSFFPVMAKYYKCNFLWYDAEQNFMKACICKRNKNGTERDVILSRKSFVPPKSLCEKSIWKLRVICIYYNNHFMCLNEYLKID